MGNDKFPRQWTSLATDISQNRLVLRSRHLDLYREHPVDGKVDGLPDWQQVDERPDGGGDETDYDHEQKPIGTR